MYLIDHKSGNLITLHPMLIFVKNNCGTSMQGSHQNFRKNLIDHKSGNLITFHSMLIFVKKIVEPLWSSLLYKKS